MAIIVDSNVIIEGLRGEAEAIAFLEAHRTQIVLSAVSVGELYQGIRNRADALKIESILTAVEIAPITADIARKGGEFSRQYRRSHGCGLLDCFIAATAQWHGLTLLTFNLRHFPMLPDARRPYK